MIRSIICDLDRTLLRTDKTISDYTIQILNVCRTQGILLMGATARPARAIETYHKQVCFDAAVMPDLLERFIHEADTNRKDDSHAIAAAQIAAHMGDCIDRPVLTIQKRAHTLFVQSTDEMIRKYSHSCSDLSR